MDNHQQDPKSFSESASKGLLCDFASYDIFRICWLYYVILYYVILLYCVYNVIITTDSHTLCKQGNAKTQDWRQVKMGIEALNGLNDAAVHAHDVATAALDEVKEAILDVIFDVINAVEMNS